METKDESVSLEEYTNLNEEEQGAYTRKYMYEENVITVDVFKIVSSLPKTFIGLKSLTTEIIEDDNEDKIPFLKILINALISVDEILKKSSYSVAKQLLVQSMRYFESIQNNRICVIIN